MGSRVKGSRSTTAPRIAEVDTTHTLTPSNCYKSRGLHRALPVVTDYVPPPLNTGARCTPEELRRPHGTIPSYDLRSREHLMFMAASSVTRYLNTYGSAHRSTNLPAAWEAALGHLSVRIPSMALSAAWGLSLA